MVYGRERAVGCAAAATVIGLLAAPGFGRVATLTAARDNTLYESETGALSSGVGEAFFVGRTGQPAGFNKRRGLVYFDLQAGFPSNAIFGSASVSMYSTKALGASLVFLHRAGKDWGEGTSDAGLFGEGGQGAESTTGDATWVHTFYDTATWTNPGGDFSGTVSATSNLVGFGAISFASTAQLNADVQGWIASPATNFGWLVLGNEAALSGNAKRIASRENPDENIRPKLVIDYSASTWKAGAGGNWSANGNWDFGVPNGVGAEANLSFAVLGNPAAVIPINVDGARTIGTLNFESPNRYVLSGSPLTFDRAAGRNAITAINGGSHEVATAVHLGRSTDVDVEAGSAVNITGDLTTAAGIEITKTGGGTFTAKHVRAAALKVDAGTVAIAPSGTAANTSRVESLEIAPGAKLDLADNDVIVDYAVAGPSPEFALRDEVLTYRNGPGAEGIGFTETVAEDVILAFGEASELAITTFNTITVDATTIVGKYTYYGDANFDGQVTTDDYVAVDLGLGTGDSWVQGDFDLNGVVTTDDYVVVDLNLGKGTGDPLAFAEEQARMIALHTEMFGQSYVEKLAYASEFGWVAASVPEPAALGLAALGIVAAARPRRRVVSNNRL